MDALVRAMAGLALVALLLGSHVAWAQTAGWDQTTPFKQEDSPRSGVDFQSSTTASTQISMDEAMKDDAGIGIPIAIMNYVGDVAPNITGFEESKTNENLGAVALKDGNGIWHLLITKPQDYENPSQRGYRFYYNIGSGAVMSHRFAINFRDIDDNAPSISLTTSKCVIDENAFDDASKKCYFNVFDADSYGMQNLKYAVKDSVIDGNLFEIVTESITDPNNVLAVLKVKTPGLDFEAFSLHILSITVNDTHNNQGEPYSCVVQVNDIADQNPVWKTIFATENVKELEEKTIQVLATDGDVIINAEIWYELDYLDMALEHHQYFIIDKQVGTLSVKPIPRDELKLETDVFRFNVTAFEKDDLSSRISSTVIIIVEDVNNKWPTITPQEALSTTIDEGAAVQLDLKIQVDDADLGQNGQFSIKLEDSSGHNWDDHFMVIPSNGYQSTPVVISVTNPTALDFENPDMQVITLQIVATEAMDSTHIGKKEVVVILKDINDEFPLFAKDAYEVSVPENAKKGDPVAVIRATDKDLEDRDKVTHTLTSGQQMMVIDSLTGVITVAEDYAFDHEMQSLVIVQVMAEDSASHRTYVQLKITVDDVNDTPPTLNMPTKPPNVKELSPVGTEIKDAAIQAVDRDLDADLSFSIDWKKSAATKQGARVSNTSLYDECIEVVTSYDSPNDHGKATATLKVKQNKLNWVDFDTLALQIVVTDSKTVLPEFEDKKQAEATLTITIEDINNFAPEFTQESLNGQRRVLELSGTDQLIGSVVAIDRDGPGFNDITYSLEEADPSWPPGLVKIHPTNGELRVDKDGGIVLDGVDKPLKYKVIASDNELEGSAVIEITVIDTNNNKPQVILENDTFYRQENTPSGNLITRILYTDADVREEYKTSSFILDPKENHPNIQNLLSINISSGELRVDLKEGAILDRDAPDGQPSYDIKIILRDNWQQGNSAPSLESTAIIKLILTDVNDNAPKFRDVVGCLASPMENTTQNTIISTDVFADDVDDGVNGQVTYFVDGYDAENRPMEGLPAELFSIDQVGGQVRVLENLVGLWDTYNLHLVAKDNPVDTSNQTETRHTFKICVQDINDNSPVFVYPEPGRTIRLRQSQTIGGDLFDSNNKTLPLLEASDADDGENSLVTLSLGAGEVTNFFEVDNQINQRNKAKLKLIKEPDSPSKTFEVIFIATDAGTPPRSSQAKVSIKFVPDGNPPPEFNDREASTSFWENERGVQQDPFELPEAIDDDNEGLDVTNPDYENVYYYIIGATSNSATGPADASGVFILDKITRKLGLNAAVDREVTPSFTVAVLATNNDSPPANPTVNPGDPSQITITITIDDENDSPPEFEKEIFSGGIATGDKNGMTILTLKANDPDLNDPVTYDMFGPIKVSDPSLDNIKDRAFFLNKNSGVLSLLFDPIDQMSGFFEFQVNATDSSPDGGDNHVATAGVKVFLISVSNRVTFIFRNEITVVEENKSEIMEIFSDVINFNCTIDSVASSVDDDGARMENQTDVVTHFIDLTKNEAVKAAKVIEIVSGRETKQELTSRFWELRLDLFDYDLGGDSVTENLEGLLQIVLIVVSVVLGTLVIILFAAFFLKTRSLNRRLEALSTTKFGSQDSGLNRVGMAVPNTNRHAVEGSNPVWNENIAAKDYDIMSEDSDDSDLIGVEDRPEFETTSIPEEAWRSEGTINGGYQPDAPRRVSLNPLSMAGVGDGPRRVSVNPLSAHHVDMDSPEPDDDEFGNPEHSNFSFGKPLGVPTTEL